MLPELPSDGLLWWTRTHSILLVLQVAMNLAQWLTTASGAALRARPDGALPAIAVSMAPWYLSCAAHTAVVTLWPVLARMTLNRRWGPAACVVVAVVNLSLMGTKAVAALLVFAVAPLVPCM